MTAAPAAPARAEHLVPLHGSEWSMWRTFLVRGAGMPFAWSEDIDGHAHEPLVREALLWQNPNAARMLLRPSRPGAQARRRREVLAAYVQRYTAKNETIGFFGPVCWGEWADATDVAAGPGLTRRRTVRFEHWAVVELARALERRHGLRRWVAPARSARVAVRGERVWLAVAPTALAPELARVLRLVDGVRSVRELASELGTSEEDVSDALERLGALGAVTWELAAFTPGPHPERLLRGRLLRTGDPAARSAALADLDRLEAARDRVAEAAGDAEAVDAALARLAETFESLTGTPAMRRPGELYAGRFVVYEDAVRDATVELDVRLAERLAPALALLLQSARWLTCAVEDAYHADALALHARLGGGAVPLARLLGARFDALSRSFPERVAPIAAELRRRWSTILAAAPGERVVERTVDELEDAVADAFPADRPGWTAARYHCPDVFIAADGAGALAAGDCSFVIGELHVALNTVDAGACVVQHDHPETLLAAVERDVPGRVLPVFPRAVCNSRTYPPTALQSPAFTYLGVSPDPPDCPDGATLLPLFGLVAVVEDGRLFVRDEEGTDLPWSEAVGEYLSIVCVNMFGLLEPAPHTPRVVVDGVVVAREAWRFPLHATPLARRERGAARHAAVREWAEAAGLPRRIYLSLGDASKPQYVDLASELSVDVAARFVRRGIDRGLAGDLAVTEMLPGPEALWLTDADGRRYTSELRIVCVDGSGS